MSLRRLVRFAALAAFASAAVFAFAQTASAPATYSPKLWSGMQYRNIGPFRGGRVTAVTGVPSEPNTFYFGSTGGGVWKTTDAGYSWHNVTDKYFAVGSMGALAVADSDPNVIYAGTGSADIRSNVSIGRGIYKSTDAGKTWSFAGLPDIGQTRTILISPTDPNLVYVAAQGNPFIDTPERGVYRSRDGGASWKKVFYINEKLGATAMAMDPAQPNILYVAMWYGRRKPWTIISGAPASAGSGIYKSIDGGDTWHKLGGGLPTGLFGRANVAVSPAAPNRVYALIEARPGQGLYRSDDAGATWTLMNGEDAIITRPFYYDALGVDPNNADIVYVGDETWFKSTDGGKTFARQQVPHGDNHGIWINPKNSLDMIQCNDGGANVSLDGGHTWSSQLNQPTAEIYQVAVDNQYPYRVYGAQQDDATVILPSLPLGDGQTFRSGPGCETGPIIPETQNPNIVYGGCKGQFSILDIRTHNEQQYWIGAQSLYGNGGGTLLDRFQRVSPMEVSPWPPYAVYYGSQYVYRSTNGGQLWHRISPDLTWNPPGAPQRASGTPITRDATGEEIYSVIYSIRESPVQKGVIWTGSNDGLIYVTRNDGKNWTNVTPKGLLPGGRVQNIEPSPHNAARAYAAIYRYLLGDFRPYIYRTDDYGAHWTLLTNGHNGIAADEPTRVVREDPVRPGLLYAGTEFGIYVSFDDGGQWQSFQQNLPHVPVTDIKLAHGDLILSTQGRSDWIMDNLGPLRQLTPAVAAAPDYLFQPATAIRSGGRGGFGFGRTAGPTYPAAGATIGYYLAAKPAQPLKLEFLDASGRVLDTISSNQRPPAGRGGFFARFRPQQLSTAAGMHRYTWNLRLPNNGPTIVPGAYQVRLSTGSWSQTQPLTIQEDPRITADGVTQADLQEQFDHNMRVLALVNRVNRLVARVRRADQSKPPVKALVDELITPAIRYSRPGLQTQITYLYSMTNMADQKPGQDALNRYAVLKAQLDRVEAQAAPVLAAAANR